MKWQIVHIPGKASSSELSTVDVLASFIEPKHANTLVRKLNQANPLEEIRHVKRVRRRSNEGNIELSVILCLSGENGNYLEGLSEDLLELIDVYQLKPFQTKVAKFAALSKEEWEEQCKLWPTSYHPSNNLEALIEFSDGDSQIIFSHMKNAIWLSKSSCPINKVVNAAIIVDPSTKQIISTATDETCKWKSAASNSTTKHVNFNKNGLVTENKPSEAISNTECDDLYSNVSCLYPWNWMTQSKQNNKIFVNCSSSKLWHPLRHASIVAIEAAAARDRMLYPVPASLNHLSHTNETLQDSSNGSPAKRQKTNFEDDEKSNEQDDDIPPESSRPYLCTGFDMYLVWEPCAMCAMGLVHQRIRRIFYAFPNPNAGALGSVYRLQGEKSLNHHYSVFRVLIPENYINADLNGTDNHS